MWGFPWCVEDGITFEWSGIEFSSQRVLGESPQWGLGEADWWDGGVQDSETFRAPRGQFVGEPHEAARTVSWSGLLKCGSRADLLEAMRDLRSARGTVLRVWEVDEGFQAACRKAQVQVTALTDVAATYSVTVVLDDPLVSSVDDLVLNQSVTVRNIGSVPSWPRVAVSGPTAAGPVVKIGSWSTQAPRALGQGEEFVVDTRQGSCFVGGSMVFPVLATLPSIPAGGTVTISTDRGVGSVEGVSAWL